MRRHPSTRLLDTLLLFWTPTNLGFYYWKDRNWSGGGGGLPYLGMVGRFRGDDPHFGGFQTDWVPILYLNTIQLTPSFCRTKWLVSLTFSSIDPRLGPNIGLIFHQNVFFWQILSILYQFSLFRSNWPPFSLIFKSFWPLIFTKP